MHGVYAPTIALSTKRFVLSGEKQVRSGNVISACARFRHNRFYCCDVDGEPDGAELKAVRNYTSLLAHRYCWSLYALTLPKIPVAEKK